MSLRRLLNTPRARKQALVVAVFLAVASIATAGIIGGVTAASFAVGVWGVTTASLSMWRPWQPQPDLVVSLVGDGSAESYLRLGREAPKRPIDRQAIIAEQISKARRARPADRNQPRRDLYRSMSILEGYESYEKACERHEQQLAEYAEGLDAWLGQLVALQWPASAYVRVRVRIDNRGGAPAEGVRVRLRFPDGLLVSKTPPALKPPPEVPAFKQRERYDALALRPHFSLDDIQLPAPVDLRRPKVDGPHWLRDGEDRVAEYRIDRLVHQLYDLSDAPLDLVAARPGVFETRWEAHASNLAVAARGVIRVEAISQHHDQAPITTLAEALDHGGVPITHG